MRWVALILLAGCAESQSALQDARAAVQKNGEELLRLRSVIIAGCAEPPPAPPFCDELVKRFNELQAGYTVVNEAMP